MSTPILLKIKDFFLKNEHKIVLIVGFCFISTISYQFGVMQGQKWQQKPLIIEKTINIPSEAKIGQKEASENPQDQSQIQLTKTAASPMIEGACTYIGSKSSTKFYLSTCSWAKRIKPENVVCFKSAEEAISKGRTESKCAK